MSAATIKILPSIKPQRNKKEKKTRQRRGLRSTRDGVEVGMVIKYESGSLTSGFEMFFVVRRIPSPCQVLASSPSKPTELTTLRRGKDGVWRPKGHKKPKGVFRQ